jgi:hypothetical protein
MRSPKKEKATPFGGDFLVQTNILGGNADVL